MSGLLRVARRLLIPALLATTASGGAAWADEAKDREALAALRDLVANPFQKPAPILGAYEFFEAQYLIDRLSGPERRALSRALREGALELPGAIETAIRAKAARPANNRG